MAADLHFLTIAEAAELIAARRLSPVELTETYLARIAALDDQLDSFVTVTAERARRDAQKAEAEIAASGPRGPLHGIPYCLKDIFDVAGVRTTAQSRLLADNFPVEDSACAAKLEAAGAILLGKNATWEFAHGGPSWDVLFPPARNPWNTDHSPSGSSSGSAVAVAAGLAPMSLGTDTGGSIRGPAAACGVAGLKPTYGRVSRRGIVPNCFSHDHAGPLAWTSRDVALIMTVDRRSRSARPRLGRPRGAGLCRRADRERRGAGHRRALALAGGRVAARPCHARGFRCGARRFQGARRGNPRGLLAAHPRLSRDHEGDRGERAVRDPRPTTSALGRSCSGRACAIASSPADSCGRRNTCWRCAPAPILRARRRTRWRRWTSSCCPPASLPGRLQPEHPASTFTQPSYTSPFSVAGNPALSVCSGFDEAGLPFSLQIVGRLFDEATVLRAGDAYERVTPWRQRRPELALAMA